MGVLVITEDCRQNFDELTEWCKNKPEEAAHRIARLEAEAGNPSYGKMKSAGSAFIDALGKARAGKATP